MPLPGERKRAQSRGPGMPVNVIRRAGKLYSGAHGLAEKGRMALREIYQ